jgi:hypothetical protein
MGGRGEGGIRPAFAVVKFRLRIQYKRTPARLYTGLKSQRNNITCQEALHNSNLVQDYAE